MISVITLKEEWKRIIGNMDNYDFYHTYDYHQLSKAKNEEPILVVYEAKDQMIAIPFLKRPIDGGSYFDFTSVYGYAGPVSKNINADFDNTTFVQQFNSFLNQEKIVSIFSRLHPYLANQTSILRNMGSSPTLGKVVNIDLTQPLDVQRSMYGKSTKNRTNKCRRETVVSIASSEEDINTFIAIYNENMDRLGADKRYYFSKDYFFKFLQAEDFKTDILLVQHLESQQAIAGSMFVKTKNMVQFHLSGTKTEYLKLAPANVFLDEMRLLATEQGYTYFNLGGGLGSKEDSLFNFKASFSKDYHDFKVWKYITDIKLYDELAKALKKPVDPDYFPIYRS